MNEYTINLDIGDNKTLVVNLTITTNVINNASPIADPIPPNIPPRLLREEVFALEYDIRTCRTYDQLAAIRTSKRFIHFTETASMEQLNYLMAIVSREISRLEHVTNKR